ncbi:hypothetical protein GWK47_037042 [Chionoecetes opilio]|uniref:Uncharacterized protein n=1 Tax=Chionoecetes opilio TaxID=41210 RepID=A0A8J4YQU1_CHIOP|nr:hypothetical protein GWK47_037042 [Chionoecetes opilio]
MVRDNILYCCLVVITSVVFMNIHCNIFTLFHPWVVALIWRPSQGQYTVHETPDAQQLQFACEHAVLAAVHWQLITSISAGAAGGPLAISGVTIFS